MKRRVEKKAIEHLRKDMKGYKKQRSHLKEEIKEDKELIRDIKGKKYKE